ncbi:homocysteine S-methyltransferase family protein [Taklimakanibacter deserti]|uniref:homocysteine S-methyltransferase family protein n=1 Tax=Taklimakanibacter deserti TaxID=2267839 RepID=UPI000E647B89
MSKYRQALPQLKGGVFLTDGGLETTLVFLEGVELSYFASFPLITTESGREKLKNYFRPYIELAKLKQVGFILDTPTWRASPDWAEKLGFSPDRLIAANRLSVDFLVGLRQDYAGLVEPLVINGVIGPRGDGYKVETRMSAEEAQAYHTMQMKVFSDSEADMVTAVTLNYVDEALGIMRAAKAHKMPLVISFTVETDGRLPSGESLREAIETVDRVSGNYPIYYMINCAHPEHFEDVLSAGAWLKRIRGLRANSSAKSHAELDAATELDIGDPENLGARYSALRAKLPNLVVLGGCCGTDHRHLTAISDACLAA